MAPHNKNQMRNALKESLSEGAIGLRLRDMSILIVGKFSEIKVCAVSNNIRARFKKMTTAVRITRKLRATVVIVDDVLSGVASGKYFNKPFSFIKTVSEAFDSVIMKYSRNLNTSRIVKEVTFYFFLYHASTFLICHIN